MNISFLNNIKLIFSRPISTDTIEGRAHERSRRIALTAITAAISKVLSAIIPFITVKLTLDYLGNEMYGLWNAVTSFFALFVFADLGLGNGLQTQLSRACGKENKRLQSQIVFNSYAVLIFVSMALIFIFLIVNPFIDWPQIMNASNTDVQYLVGSVILAIVLPKFLSVPLSLIQRVQLAYQEGYNSNLWQCVASILSLISIWIIYYFNLGKILMIWTTSLIPLLIYILNSAVYYKQKPVHFFSISNFDYSIINMLLKNGMLFFVLSILTTAGLAIDTFIVANVSGLDNATPFSILHKVAVMISMVVGMLCTPLWSANGEALARGEKQWVEKNTKKMVKITLAFSILISIILIITSKWFFKIWLGPDFTFSLPCLIGMCITQIILSGISPYFMILNAANVIKKQILIFLLFTCSTLILKFWLSHTYGVNIIPWISNFCYMICIVPFVVIWSKSILKQ